MGKKYYKQITRDSVILCTVSVNYEVQLFTLLHRKWTGKREREIVWYSECAKVPPLKYVR